MQLHPVGLVALLLAAVLVAPQPVALVETGTITGHVTDSTGGSPVANARVIVVGTALSASTDSKGAYTIANVPAGTYTVRAQFIGYKPAEKTGVRVTANATVTLDFKLESSATVLSAIVVDGSAAQRQPRASVAARL